MDKESINVIFKCFAKCREIVKNDQVEIKNKKDCTLQECIDKLLIEYPLLTSTFIKRCRLAINNSYITNYEIILNENTEILIIPPISGG